MAVHANSVISTWVNTFDPVFYTALTSQENNAYTRGGNNTFANWSPFFTAINTAMTTWKNTSRQSLLTNFITPLYSYKVMSDTLGSSSSLITNGSVDALNIFTMNGFIAATKSRSESYYDDLVIVTTPTPSITSAKASAAAATVGGGVANETSVTNGYIGTITALISSTSFTMLFQDPPTTGVTGYLGKAGMANFVFNTLHYKHIYQNLNVGSLILPPSVS